MPSNRMMVLSSAQKSKEEKKQMQARGSISRDVRDDARLSRSVMTSKGSKKDVAKGGEEVVRYK